jgi:oligopeptide transport system permease protein
MKQPRDPNAPFVKNSLSMQVDLSKFTLVSDDEKQSFDVMRPPSSFWKDGWKNFKKNKLAIGSLIVLILIVLLIIIMPHFVPYKYGEPIRIQGKRDQTVANLHPFEWSEKEQECIDQGNKLFPHIMGTDQLGRDYFIRVLIGTRISLIVGFFASLIVLVIGLIYGSISGFLGGKVDLVMMRIVDVIYSLPDTLIIILLAFVLKETIGKQIQGTVFAKLGTNMVSMFIVFGCCTGSAWRAWFAARSCPSKKTNMCSRRAMGASGSRIIRKHILPNCISVIIISTALQIPAAIFTESFLSFIGLGVAHADAESLGSLANAARGGMQSFPSSWCFPAIMHLLIVLTLNLIGDGLRDAFDPKAEEVSDEQNTVAAGKNLHTSFFTDSGEVHAVNGVSFNLEARASAGHRRRVRLRQERDGLFDHADPRETGRVSAARVSLQRARHSANCPKRDAATIPR